MFASLSKIEAVPFLEKKSLNFKKSFLYVFGDKVRDEKDIIFLAKDFCDLKWDVVENGRKLRKRKVYELQGVEKFFLHSAYNKHHWPPISRGGVYVIKTPIDFHKGWHLIFMNLYKKEEIERYLQMLFNLEEIESIGYLYRIIEHIRD